MSYVRNRSIQFVLIALSAISLFGGENRWTIKGPQAGRPLKIVFDPADSSIVYAATTNGVFRSSDGGQHWIVGAGTLGMWFNDVAVVSSAPQTLFAASVYGLYKSSDRGATWSLQSSTAASYLIAVSADGSIVYSDAMGGPPIRSADGGVTFGSPGSGFPAFIRSSALVIDPQNSDTVYASVYGSTALYKSTDGGVHWTAQTTEDTRFKYLYSLVIDPTNSSVLYATGFGIFKTTDAGVSWIELTNGLDSASYFSLAISTAPSTLVAATNKGLYKSTNAGATWSGPSQPLFGSLVAIDPRNASNVLLVSNDLMRSTDGGSTFTPSTSGLIAASTSSIAVDPRKDSVIYTSGDAGIFKSIDYGESWNVLLRTSTQSVAFDPFNSQTLYAITSGNFTRSLNGGLVWEDFSTGLPSQVERGLPTATHIRLDPLTPGTIYTTNLGLPYKKVGAGDWTIKNSGLPGGPYASFLEIDPHNGSVLYTGGTFGLYKTSDGGESWQSSSNGLPRSGVASLRIDPFDSNHLLSWKSLVAYESKNGGASWAPFAASGRPLGVLTFDPTARGRIYNDSDAVERSDDGGKTWVVVSEPAFDHGGILVISPSGNWLYSSGVWVFHYTRRSRAVAH